MHLYEVRPRKDRRGFRLISEVLPFGGLWYQDVGAAVSYAKFYSRSQGSIIRVFNEAGGVVEEHEEKGVFKEAS